MAKRQEKKVSPKSEHTQETNDRVNIQCVLALRVLQFILMEVLSGLGSLTGRGEGERERRGGRERERKLRLCHNNVVYPIYTLYIRHWAS